MLRRVADALTWMSRYIERAENNARLLNVNLQSVLSLHRPGGGDRSGIWEPVISSLEDRKLFYSLYEAADAPSVLGFLTLEPRNPNSISSCLGQARENARGVREQVTTEMWEALNRLYLFVREDATREAFAENPYQILLRVIEGSQLFQGVTDSTLNHTEGWEFIQIGKWAERADLTSRILDLKYHRLLPSGERVGGAVDTSEWIAVLRSCSAFEPFRRAHTGPVAPWQVAQFLILDPTFPRSIRFCVQQLDTALRRISGSDENEFANLAEQLSGQLRSRLAFSGIADIFARGLHEYLDQIQLRLIEINRAIEKAYCAWME